MKEDAQFYVGQKAFILKGNEVFVLDDPHEGLDYPGGKIQEEETDLIESLKRDVREDMFAHKLIAFLERIAVRDIFYVNYFTNNNWPINRKIVESLSGDSFKEALEKYIDLLEKMDNKNILDGMCEFFTNPEKDSLRAKLKPDTVFLLKVMHDNAK